MLPYCDKRVSCRFVRLLLYVTSLSLASSAISKVGMECKLPKKRSGRPPILNRREKDRFLRKFKCMREQNPNVMVGAIAMECELHHASTKMLCRFLNQSGYKYVRPRRKGILTASDKRKRVAYAVKAVKQTTPAFWTEDVLLYLDAVSFVHKRHPYEDALAAAARVWRMPGEGLELTANGRKDLRGGNICHYVVGISFGGGAVLVEEYTTMNGKYFLEVSERSLHKIRSDRAAAKGKDTLLFLQDNDPSQNSAKAKEAPNNIGAEVIISPARSPDFNPIENFFHNVKRKLRQDALDSRIVNEDLIAFKHRSVCTISNYDKGIIVKTISSM